MHYDLFHRASCRLNGASEVVFIAFRVLLRHLAGPLHGEVPAPKPLIAAPGPAEVPPDD